MQRPIFLIAQTCAFNISGLVDNRETKLDQLVSNLAVPFAHEVNTLDLTYYLAYSSGKLGNVLLSLIISY